MIDQSRKALHLNDKDYKVYLENIKKHLEFKDQENTEVDYYTPHGCTHSQAVEYIVDTMLSKCTGLELTELERFLLLASIWTHDLGMFSDIAKRYFDALKECYSTDKRRKKHEEISAWYLLENYMMVFLGKARGTPNYIEETFLESKLRSYVDVINLIIKYHRRATKIEECPKTVYLGAEKINCRLLACFLRLGDTLNIDSTRYDPKMYAALLFGEFNRDSRLHWLKSFIISNIYLDAENRQVVVNIHLDELDKEDSKKRAKEEEENYLKDLIRRDIDVDLAAVRETFREYSLPIYVKTDIIVSRIPGFDVNKRSDIAGGLSDLKLRFSPNSTKLIDEALNCIECLCDANIYQHQSFHSQLDQLKQKLKSVQEERTCHVGLQALIEGFNSIIRDMPSEGHAKIDSCRIECFRNDLRKFVKDFRKTQKDAKDRILTERNVRFMNDVQNIFLFGYSQSVIDFLKKYTETLHQKRWIDDNIYIFEDAAKRRLGIGNTIDYNDGQYYSTKIKGIGFNNVKIIPDAEFATILAENAKYSSSGKWENPIINGSNSVVLIGANGVDTFLFNLNKFEEDLERFMREETLDGVSKQTNANDIISDLNVGIKNYNEKHGTKLKPIGDMDYRIEAEPAKKWRIIDRYLNEEKKYFLKADDKSIKFVDADCRNSCEMCQAFENDLNNREITERLREEFKKNYHELHEPRIEIDQNKWHIIDHIAILLMKDPRIKVYKDNMPYYKCSEFNGTYIESLKKLPLGKECKFSKLDNETDLQKLKKDLNNKLGISEDATITKIDVDSWQLKSGMTEYILKDGSRVSIFEADRTSFPKDSVQEPNLVPELQKPIDKISFINGAFVVNQGKKLKVYEEKELIGVFRGDAINETCFIDDDVLPGILFEELKKNDLLNKMNISTAVNENLKIQKGTDFWAIYDNISAKGYIKDGRVLDCNWAKLSDIDLSSIIQKLEEMKTKTIRDLSPSDNLNALLKSHKVTADSKIEIIDERTGYIREKNIKLIRSPAAKHEYKSSAYCHIDKKFRDTLYLAAPEENIDGRNNHLLDYSGICEELRNNKLENSETSIITKLKCTSSETTNNSPQEASENSEAERDYWLIDDILKEQYIIKKEASDKEGAKPLNVYRLDKGPCGHSAGHLMVAITAKEFGIPVVVIAESLKKGKTRWKLDAQRDEDWFITQEELRDELESKGIVPINYREDKIPENLISRVISDDAPPIWDLEDLKSHNAD